MDVPDEMLKPAITLFTALYERVAKAFGRRRAKAKNEQMLAQVRRELLRQNPNIQIAEANLAAVKASQQVLSADLSQVEAMLDRVKDYDKQIKRSPARFAKRPAKKARTNYSFSTSASSLTQSPRTGSFSKKKSPKIAPMRTRKKKVPKTAARKKGMTKKRSSAARTS